MADERIGLLIELLGDQAAMTSLRQLKQLGDELNNHKYQMKVEMSQVDRDIANVKRYIADLRRDLAQAIRVKADPSQIEHLRNELDQAIRKKNELVNTKDNIRINMQVDTTSLSLASEIISDMVSRAGELTSILSSLSGGAASFADGITSAFQGMASVFNSDILTTMEHMLTAMATRQLVGGMGGIISRYDIMSTFIDYMELAGVTADQANDALSRVDQSIRGIPIGLDEAAFRLRRYQMYLGDIERATNLTIGLQRALIAGGSSEQMQTTAYTQIDRLLATGKLGQSRQWISLFNGLGVSMKFLKEELALDPTTRMQDVAADLASGAIAADEFIRAIERLASNEGLNSAIDIYKSTVSAWLANIKNAVKRGGQAVMVALNETMQDTMGVGITGILKRVRDGIDAGAKEASNYIKSNPQLIESVGEMFGGFRDRLGKFDFGLLISKVVENMERLFDVIGRIIDRLPKGFFEEFSAFAVTLAGPLAKAFSAVSSGAGIMLGIFERFKDFDFTDLIDKIITQVERLANVVSKILGLIPDGLLGDLMAFGLVWGKPLARVFGLISSSLMQVSTVAAGGQGTNMFGQLIYMATNYKLFLPLVGILGGVAAAFYAIWKNAEETEKRVGDAFEESFFPDHDEMIERADDAIEASRRAREGFKDNLKEIETNSIQTQEALSKVIELNRQLGDTTNIQRRTEVQADLNAALAEFNELSGLNLESGNLSSEITTLAKSYTALEAARAKQDAYSEAQRGLTGQNISLEIERETLEFDQKRLRDYTRQLEAMLPGGVRGQLNARLQAMPGSGMSGIIEMWEALGEGEEWSNEKLNEWKRTVESYKEGEERLQAINEEIERNNELYEVYGKRVGEVGDEIARLSALDFTPLGSEIAFTQLDESLQNTVASFNTFRDDALEAFGKVLSGFTNMTDAMKQDALTSADEISKSFTSQLEYLANFEENFRTIMQFAAEHQELDFSGLFTKLTEDGPEAGAAAAAAVVGAMNAYDPTAEYNLLSQWISDADAIEAGKQAASALFAGMQEAAQNPDFLKQVFNNPEWFADGGLVKWMLGEDWETQFSQLNEVKTDELQSSMNDAKDKVTDLGDALSTLPEVAQDAMNGISNSAASVTLQAAMTAVDNLISKINQIPRNITVGVNVQQKGINSINRYGNSGISFSANGGPVYYADGGFVTRGTDTVPAMLTPGEFVVNRNATKKLFPLLNAINGHHIDTAFASLMNGLSARVSSSVHNIRDNHASVVINNYGTTGQGYTQKQAFRFAGAL